MKLQPPQPRNALSSPTRATSQSVLNASVALYGTVEAAPAEAFTLGLDDEEEEEAKSKNGKEGEADASDEADGMQKPAVKGAIPDEIVAGKSTAATTDVASKLLPPPAPTQPSFADHPVLAALFWTQRSCIRKPDSPLCLFRCSGADGGAESANPFASFAPAAQASPQAASDSVSVPSTETPSTIRCRSTFQRHRHRHRHRADSQEFWRPLRRLCSNPWIIA